MPYPTCDNECTRLGWTEALIEMGAHSLHVSHAPDAETDGAFAAFCHDGQEMIQINGWMIESYEVVR